MDKERIIKIIGLFVASFLVGLLLGVGVYEVRDFFRDRIDGHQAVDLGLSVRWAKVNLGADNEADRGILDSYDQAEQQSWGGKWRMPTSEEWDELISNCQRRKTDKGYYFKGPNGNTMFIPMVKDSVFVYWSSTPSHNVFSSEADSARTELDARLCATISGILVFPSFPIPAISRNVGTRLVCE